MKSVFTMQLICFRVYSMIPINIMTYFYLQGLLKEKNIEVTTFKLQRLCLMENKIQRLINFLRKKMEQSPLEVANFLFYTISNVFPLILNSFIFNQILTNVKGFHVETEHVLTQLVLIPATVKLSGRASTVKQVNVIYGYLVKTMVIG